MAEPTILSQIIQIRTQIYNTQIRKYADTHIHKGVSQYTKESERSLGHDSGAILSQIIQIQTQIHNKQIYKHTNTQIRKNTNTQIQGGFKRSQRGALVIVAVPFSHRGDTLSHPNSPLLTFSFSKTHFILLQQPWLSKPPKAAFNLN